MLGILIQIIYIKLSYDKFHFSIQFWKRVEFFLYTYLKVKNVKVFSIFRKMQIYLSEQASELSSSESNNPQPMRDPKTREKVKVR